MERDVSFKGNRLNLTNNAGRAVAIENFSAGAVKTVTPGNEPSIALAEKNAYYSEKELS